MGRKSLNDLDVATVTDRKAVERELRNAVRGETAREAIGKLSPGCEKFGFTKGQFSLVDLIETVSLQTGAADVVVSTWTAAGADVTLARSWLKSRRLKSVRFIVDYSFERRQAEYCRALREAFGDDAIRVTVTHAKFVLIKNADWNIVIRTSMNLNHNPRFENFEISDDPEFMAFFMTMVNRIWATQSAGEGFENRPAQNKSTFEGLFAGDADGMAVDLVKTTDIFK